MNYYCDTESGNVLSTNELKREFMNLAKDDFKNFKQYLSYCLEKEILKEVWK